MAVVRPFVCVRPEVNAAARVAALPYDVFTRAEAKAETEREPMSFLKVDRAETQFPDSVDMYADCVYEKAGEILAGMIKDGTLIRDEAPCYYIYELISGERSQTGIVACCSIDDYESRVIKKHENTKPIREKDRIRHINACSAQTGPVFLTYRGKSSINSMVAGMKKELPLYDFTARDGVAHRVWRISDPEKINELEKEFEDVKSIYIADGHHRAMSAAEVGFSRRKEEGGDGSEEYNFFLSVIFPAEEVQILDSNRAVRDLNGMSREKFLERISRDFDISVNGSSEYRPEKKGEFGMYLDDVWYRLISKRIPTGDSVDDLDVSVLQNTLLGPVLGIEDPRTDRRIAFIGGIRGLKELERRCHSDMRVAFSMYPTQIEELFEVADEGRLMPPKSTWFDPKLLSGLFIHEI